MANYSGPITYVLYNFNDKQGRVPFLDNSTQRSALTTAIMAACGLSDS